MLEKIKSISEEFFQKLGVDIDNIEVIEQETNIFTIKIETKESSILIGTNGKNLDNILNILKIIFKKNVGEGLKIHIEVNDYLKSKDDRLKNYIISKISLVEKSGKDLKLPFFSAYDRKKIHSIVGEYGNAKIYTKSVGEGKERRLFICKTGEKITIDFDGNDI